MIASRCFIVFAFFEPLPPRGPRLAATADGPAGASLSTGLGVAAPEGLALSMSRKLPSPV